jgi:hypothetical protein
MTIEDTPTPPPARRKAWHVLGYGATALLAFVLGASAVASAEPEVVEVTPQVCLEALDDTGGLLLEIAPVIDMAAELMGMVPEALTAGATSDYATASRLASRIEEMGAEAERRSKTVEGFDVAGKSAECRELAR